LNSNPVCAIIKAQFVVNVDNPLLVTALNFIRRNP
jgi:hypothetical protein